MRRLFPLQAQLTTTQGRPYGSEAVPVFRVSQTLWGEKVTENPHEEPRGWEDRPVWRVWTLADPCE